MNSETFILFVPPHVGLPENSKPLLSAHSDASLWNECKKMIDFTKAKKDNRDRYG